MCMIHILKSAPNYSIRARISPYSIGQFSFHIYSSKPQIYNTISHRSFPWIQTYATAFVKATMNNMSTSSVYPILIWYTYIIFLQHTLPQTDFSYTLNVTHTYILTFCKYTALNERSVHYIQIQYDH